MLSLNKVLKLRRFKKKHRNNVGYLSMLKQHGAEAALINFAWAVREQAEGWANVMRLHLYLAKRRVFHEGGDIHAVRVRMPFLGPKATPDNVMEELLKFDKAISEGDYEIIENLDDDMDQTDVREMIK
jgi:hypothetical protein